MKKQDKSLSDKIIGMEPEDLDMVYVRDVKQSVKRALRGLKFMNHHALTYDERDTWLMGVFEDEFGELSK